ncbi:MAG: Zn-ribbon domain-containing protein [Methanimicrococcus sp.]|nr:Zn-ribbon domain-containing protein [Methanimicrococcus sp.]
MPHRCTKCGSVFGDGDSVILTGCPECKWNKFFYVRNEEAGTGAAMTEIVTEEKPDSWNIEERVKEKEVKSIDSVLEDIDRALESDEVNKKDLDTDRVDSIRILDTGSYELNLCSIMNKEEIVVGIKEEGQYAIDLPTILQQSNKSSSKKKKK